MDKMSMSKITMNEIALYIENSTYLSDYRLCNSYDSLNDNIATGISNISTKKAILISIGEFLERESLVVSYYMYKNQKSNFITGYSFHQNKILKIGRNEIDRIFVDSCGEASHSKSSLCINNAFFEFIERQSMIFNYLSKSKGTKILFTQNDNIYNYLKQFTDVNVYNISLIDDVYVILVTAKHNGRYLIGAGSSNIIDIAINSAIKELYACIASFSTNDNTLKNKRLDYADIYKMIPTDKLELAYSYLNTNCNKISYKDLKSHEFDIKASCNKLYELYKIDPILFYMYPTRNIDNLKIVKFFDFNWFPSLNPKQFNCKVYDYIESVTNCKLDRHCTFIPFP